MNYCLPPDKAAAFTAALKDGTISPDKMREMTSEERRTLFAGIVGEENARDVNALLENKLLLKDQQAGMVTWAKQVSGMTAPARRDLISRIQKMDRLLNPTEERAFLADATAQKLGATVTPQEAAQISQMARDVQALKAVRDADLNRRTITDYGKAANNLEFYVDSLKPGKQGWMYWAAQILNMPRTLLTSTFLHFSAPLVQGRAMMTDPEWAQGFGQMFKYFASQNAYDDLMGYWRGHPDFDAGRQAGLSITNLGDKLLNREEALQSSILQHANEWLAKKSGLPINMIGANSRAFTGFINYLRIQSFTRMMASARALGQDVSVGSQGARDIAQMVNSLTGRGSLGPLERDGGQFASLLNAAFFAPRKWVGMVQRSNPYRYVNPNINPVARAFGARQMIGYVAATTTVLGLAKLAGLPVGLDPTKKDFLNISVGKQRFDVTDGEATLMRLMGRIFTQKYTTGEGKVLPMGYNNNPTTGSLVLDYIRGKLAPTAAALVDLSLGKDAGGNKVTIPHELWNTFGPITLQEFNDWAKSNPKDYWSLLPALLVPFGQHMQSDVPHDLGLGDGPAAQEMERLKFSDYDLPYPSGDPKFDQLVLDKLKPLVDRTMNSFVQSPGYQKMGDPQRALMLQSVLRGLERAAKGQAIAADPKAYQKLRQSKINPRLQAVLQGQQAPQPQEQETGQ
jgi:hypothetical protein